MLLWALLVLAEPAADAAALPAGAQPLVLTLPDALQLGLARDRGTRISESNRSSARADVTRAAGTYQPSATFNADYTRFNSARQGFATGAVGADHSGNVYFRVQGLLFDSGQGLLDLLRAKEDAKAADYRVTQTQLDAAKRIVTDFQAALKVQALERLNEQLVGQAQRQVDLAAARFDAKQGAKLDVTRAEVTLKNAQVELIAAQNSTRQATAKLRNDLLLPPDQPLVASDAFPVPPVDTTLATALSAARSQRPDLAAAAADLRSRHHALTRAQIARYVDAQVSGSYSKYLDTSRNIDHEYQLSASVSVPLWDGQQGRSAAEQAEEAAIRADEQLKQAREAASLEVEQAFLAWNDAQARLAGAESAQRLAAQSLAQTEESFRVGVASFNDVSDARTEFQRAETNRIQARIDRDQASLFLRLAIGRQPLDTQPLPESKP